MNKSLRCSTVTEGSAFSDCRSHFPCSSCHRWVSSVFTTLTNHERWRNFNLSVNWIEKMNKSLQELIQFSRFSQKSWIFGPKQHNASREALARGVWGFSGWVRRKREDTNHTQVCRHETDAAARRRDDSQAPGVAESWWKWGDAESLPSSGSEQNPDERMQADEAHPVLLSKTSQLSWSWGEKFSKRFWK